MSDSEFEMLDVAGPFELWLDEGENRITQPTVAADVEIDVADPPGTR